MQPATLLVIGIHREELAFGSAVAAGLDRQRIDVLTIDHGLSGRRPRADQRFHYDTLHRALYLQLLAHVRDHHRLVIDLHTGIDSGAPCADLFSRDIPRIAAVLARAQDLARRPRLIPLGAAQEGTCAETIIPEEVWNSTRFLYVGLEIYLPETGAGRAEDLAYARALIGTLAPPPSQPGAARSGARMSGRQA